MTNNGRHPTIKPRGHKPGQPPRTVDPKDYPAMAKMFSDGWGYGAIGKKFGVTGTTASRLIRSFLGDINEAD